MCFNFKNFKNILFSESHLYKSCHLRCTVKLYLQDKTHEEEPDEGVVLHQNIGRYNRMTQQRLTIVIILRYLFNNKDINRSVDSQELCQKVYKILGESAAVRLNENAFFHFLQK
jgi:hypothetical protein